MLRGAAQRAAGSAPVEPVLLIKDMTRPNGIALSPDEKYLYVANSDPESPVWMRYPLMKDGKVGAGKVLLNSKGAPGVGGPDGIKVDVKGNIYGSGPGGIAAGLSRPKANTSRRFMCRSGRATARMGWD